MYIPNTLHMSTKIMLGMAYKTFFFLHNQTFIFAVAESFKLNFEVLSDAVFWRANNELIFRKITISEFKSLS
jgi:hypothetical protein